MWKTLDLLNVSHVEVERGKLKYELGEAFGIWKFNETGKEVSKMDLKSLPEKDKKGMTNYYHNIFPPILIETDDEDGNRAKEAEKKFESFQIILLIKPLKAHI